MLSYPQKVDITFSVSDSVIAETLHFQFLPEITFGMKGDIVNKIQNKLLEKRYNLGSSGADGKFERIPTVKLLQRLHTRNEFYIGSHHPLRETLINQTGRSEIERSKFLGQIYQRVQLNPATAWEPERRAELLVAHTVLLEIS